MSDVVNLPTPDRAAPDGTSADGTSADGSVETIDITGEAFSRRLGNLLTHRRKGSKLSVGAMARRSKGSFSRGQLRQYEAGSVRLDAVSASALASLYKVDLDAILPLRTEIAINPAGGVISAGGVDATFELGDPDSVLETYLRLVRRLRNQERDDVVSLRREDVERLAAHLNESGETVVERLGALMGATKTQRRLMAGMFMTGAMVITVAVPSVAAFTGGTSTTPTGGADEAAATFVVDDGAGGDIASFDGPDPDTDAGHDAERAGSDAAMLVFDDDDDRDGTSAGGTGIDDTATDGPTVSSTPAGDGGAPGAPGPTGPTDDRVDVGVGEPPTPAQPTPIAEPSSGPPGFVTPGSGGPDVPGAGEGGNSDLDEEPVVGVGAPPVPSSVDVVVDPGGAPTVPGADAPSDTDAPVEPDDTTDDTDLPDETDDTEADTDDEVPDETENNADDTRRRDGRDGRDRGDGGRHRRRGPRPDGGHRRRHRRHRRRHRRDRGRRHRR
jgi:transcriptional regulator with XRE-family HTH domain